MVGLGLFLEGRSVGRSVSSKRLAQLGLDPSLSSHISARIVYGVCRSFLKAYTCFGSREVLLSTFQKKSDGSPQVYSGQESARVSCVAQSAPLNYQATMGHGMLQLIPRKMQMAFSGIRTEPSSPAEGLESAYQSSSFPYTLPQSSGYKYWIHSQRSTSFSLLQNILSYFNRCSSIIVSSTRTSLIVLWYSKIKMANRERCPGYEPVKAIHEGI